TKVDLPTPGTPEMPTRTAPPLLGDSAISNSREAARWSARVDSTRVMARDSAVLDPPSTSAASPAGSGLVIGNARCSGRHFPGVHRLVGMHARRVQLEHLGQGGIPF